MIASFLLLLTCAQAQTLDASYLASLHNAKSVEQIRKMQQRHFELKIARRACRAQIKDGSVPLTCYLALTLERRLTGKRTSHLLNDLDERCRRSTEAFRFSLSERDDVYASSRCRGFLGAARRIQRYRANE